MTEEDSEEHKKLVRLIREIARQIAVEVLYEHVEEYEHSRREPDSFEELDDYD